MIITPRRAVVRRGVLCVGSSTVERLDPRVLEVGGSTPSPRPPGAKCQRPHAESNALRGAGSTPAAPIRKLYIVGRRDLPPGLRVAQMFHAARQFADDHPETEGTWFRESNTIVLLEVPDREALEALVARAQDRGVEASEFSEEDDLGLTALALGPSARRIVSSLPLALRG